MYRPDVIGVTRDRRVIEIELKESFSDFKANGEKRGIQWRKNGWATEYPLKFYFAVPQRLAEQVKPLLTTEGLLTISDGESRYGPQIEVIKRATIDKRATRISVLQMGRMVMHQTATLHRAVKALGSKTAGGAGRMK